MNLIENIDRMRLGMVYNKRVDQLYRLLRNHYRDVFVDFETQSESGIENSLSPVFACKFGKGDGLRNLIAAANEEGRVALHDTSRIVSEPRINTIIAHNNAIFDLTWSNSDPEFVTASGDHSCRLWRIGEGEIKNIRQFDRHTRSVTRVIARPQTNFFYASGGRDGVIKFWDTRSDDELIVHDHEIVNPHLKTECSAKRKPRKKKIMLTVPDENRLTITGLAFQDENKLFSSSSQDGVVKVWDMRRLYSIRLHQPKPFATLETPPEDRKGFSNLCLSPCGLKLYANSVSNHLYCYDVASYQKDPIKQFSGHQVTGYYIRNSVSPDGLYVASGSSDHDVYIWAVDNPEVPLVRLKGHKNEVTCVEWCKSTTIKIASSSDDNSYKIWRPIYSKNCEEDDIRLGGEAYETENYPNIYKKTNTKFSCHIKECSGRIKKRGIKRKGSDCWNVSPEMKTPNEKRLKIQLTPIKESPTMNLPNLVIDGTSPHDHRCQRTPKSSSKENWLLNHKKSASKEKPKSVQRRRNSSKEPVAKMTLLKFFKCGTPTTLSDVKQLEPIKSETKL